MALTTGREEEGTPRERIASGEQVLSLSQIGDRLAMKRSNVAKFLARRGILPAFPKAQGYFWWESDIEAVRKEREADEEKMSADEKRRRAALARVDGKPRRDAKLPKGIGPTQATLLRELMARPRVPATRAEGEAFRRLKARGLANFILDGDGRRVWRLTPAGFRVASRL